MTGVETLIDPAPRVLREYRMAHALSQEALGRLVGYSQVTISAMERGARPLTWLERLRIAASLGVEPERLGATAVAGRSSRRESSALIEVTESYVALAEEMRMAGDAYAAARHHAQAIKLVGRASAAGGGTETRLLALAQLGLATALGDILPRDAYRLIGALTANALTTARTLEDGVLLWRALLRHGNELRKAGRSKEAVVFLEEAYAVAPSDEARSAALIPLARAYAHTKRCASVPTLDLAAPSAIGPWPRDLDGKRQPACRG